MNWWCLCNWCRVCSVCGDSSWKLLVLVGIGVFDNCLIIWQNVVVVVCLIQFLLLCVSWVLQMLLYFFCYSVMNVGINFGGFWLLVLRIIIVLLLIKFSFVVSVVFLLKLCDSCSMLIWGFCVVSVFIIVQVVLWLLLFIYRMCLLMLFRVLSMVYRCGCSNGSVCVLLCVVMIMVR